MSHMFLVEKHQQILLKNVESRPAQEIYATISSILTTVHFSEAPRRSSRGFKRWPPFKQFRSKHQNQNTMYVPRKHHPQKETSSSSSTCHKCGRQGPFARDYRASTYILVEMYTEFL